MKQKWDYVIVGAGLTGATLAERLATQLDARVLVLEQRHHIGGNVWDELDSHGIRIGRYGAHAFHTRSQKVWEYITRFTEFNDFQLKVEARFQGQWYAMPLNLDTINQFFDMNLTESELPAFLAQKRTAIDYPRNAEEAVLSRVGPELYEAFYLNYTRKQWDMEPRELDASVTMRLPIRYNRDKRYFDDPWQGIPKYGYTAMFESLLNHPNIEVHLNCGERDWESIACRRLIYTGPIDAFFGQSLGSLPYRSLKFEFETLNQPYAQHKALLNYPNEHAYTRCIEFKRLYQQQSPVTTICREYPCWNPDEPYYPVPSPQNRELYRQYRDLAQTYPRVLFCGRLGSYQYLNMDQCIAQALKLFEQELRPAHDTLEPVLPLLKAG